MPENILPPRHSLDYSDYHTFHLKILSLIFKPLWYVISKSQKLSVCLHFLDGIHYALEYDMCSMVCEVILSFEF